jgi:hypothetical protein
LHPEIETEAVLPDTEIEGCSLRSGMGRSPVFRFSAEASLKLLGPASTPRDLVETQLGTIGQSVTLRFQTHPALSIHSAKGS